jgi:hypothetical protein
MALRKGPHPERDPELGDGEQSKDAPSAVQANALLDAALR